MSKVNEYCNSLSRYLCYLLRHQPEGLHMDEYGYVLVDELVEHVNTCSKFRIDEKMLIDIVKHDEKQRYSVKHSFKGKIIKCNQGHSIPWIKMELDTTDITPPNELYHGTTGYAYFHIDRSGFIKRMERNAIHLTADIRMAWKSAKRRKNETPLVLVIDTEQMIKDGYKFGVTENGVWCIADGPRYDISTQYIKRVEEREKSICKNFEVVIDESYLNPGDPRLVIYISDEYNELKRYIMEIKQMYTDVGLDFNWTLGIIIKDVIRYLENDYCLTLDIKKAIAKQIKSSYEKYQKEHE